MKKIIDLFIERYKRRVNNFYKTINISDTVIFTQVTSAYHNLFDFLVNKFNKNILMFNFPNHRKYYNFKKTKINNNICVFLDKSKFTHMEFCKLLEIDINNIPFAR